MGHASVRAWLVVALLCLLALQLVHVARVTSSSWDEGHHLFDGYNIWTKHDYRMNAEVPPLLKLTAALPLLGKRLIVPVDQGRSQPNEAFLDGRAFLFSNGVEKVLLPARMACMVFALVLALLLYAAGREMFGPLAGLLTLSLVVFDPNLLANGTYVTTDVASACCMFATVYAFYRYTKRDWRWVGWARLLVTGVALGMAMSAKFTGIFLVPILLLLAVGDALRGQSAGRMASLVGRRVGAWLVVLLCGWIVVWGLYGFRYAPAPHGQTLRPPLAEYLQGLPNPADAGKLSLLAKYHVLPEAYLWGLANTKITAFEDTSYLFGHVYPHGNWKYFPAVLLIKSTLPLLLLLLLLPIAWRWQGWRELGDKGYTPFGREALFLLLPVVVYFGVIMSAQMDIGARHLLTAWAFLYVLVGASAARLATQLRWHHAGAVLVTVLVLWQMETSLRAAPTYMAYGNEAWGGPSQVHRYLSDANVDWGQQLYDVKRYLEQHHVQQCWFAYFPDGAIEPSDYGIHCHRLPTTNVLWWQNLPMEVPPVIEGTVLISDGDLEGIEFGDGQLNPYESFRKRKPDAVIDDGVDVYQGQFPVPLAAALVETRTAGAVAKAGNAAGALALQQQAAVLAPGSARVQLAFAQMLAREGQVAKARQRYLLANADWKANRPDLEADVGPAIDHGLQALGRPR
jgi:hypothetical protein